MAFRFGTIFAKSFILGIWQGSEFPSEASNDLRKKVHLSCLTGFWIHLCINILTKLFTIYLLNLINIQPYISIVHGQILVNYVQHIRLITKIVKVSPNHVFL